jgi:hypothetical protein
MPGIVNDVLEEQRGSYGLRPDGSKKGKGWLGPQKMTNGSGYDMSEFSVGFDFDGQQMDVPTLVPTLTSEELSHLLGGGQPTQEIMNKAYEHAVMRIRQGLSPFKD